MSRNREPLVRDLPKAICAYYGTTLAALERRMSAGAVVRLREPAWWCLEPPSTGPVQETDLSFETAAVICKHDRIVAASPQDAALLARWALRLEGETLEGEPPGEPEEKPKVRSHALTEAMNTLRLWFQSNNLDPEAYRIEIHAMTQREAYALDRSMIADPMWRDANRDRQTTMSTLSRGHFMIGGMTLELKSPSNDEDPA